MASTAFFKIFSVAILLGSSMQSAATAQPLDDGPNSSSSASSLVSRLKLDDESLNCWDTLLQLQSCTGELILFFLNGEAYLGRGCCQAIHAITSQCWPTMIDTLGFTTEETNVLQGYCSHHQLSPASPAIRPYN